MKVFYSSSIIVVFLISVFMVLIIVTIDAPAQTLKDTFDDPNWEARWEIHDDGTAGGPSQWFVGPGGGIPDGAFGTANNVLSGAGPSGGDEQPGCYALTLKNGSENWTDYRLSCDMYHMDNDYAGLFVRYVDELNYFRVWSKQAEVDHGDNTTFGMDKVVKGKWTLNFKTGGPGVGGDGITGTPIPAGKNIGQKQWFNMTVEVVGNTVTMYMEGKKMGSVTDSDLRRGKIALYNSTNPTAYDNVVVDSMAVSSAGKLSTSWGNLKAGYE